MGVFQTRANNTNEFNLKSDTVTKKEYLPPIMSRLELENWGLCGIIVDSSEGDEGEEDFSNSFDGDFLWQEDVFDSPDSYEWK